MKFFTWLAMALMSCALLAQDYNVELRTKSTSFSDDTYPFPAGMEVYDLHRKPHIIDPNGLTLIQVWGICCGGEPEVFARVEDLIRTYGDRGLDWVSINFENGLDYAGSVSEVQKYFADKEKPPKLYTDPLGYSIDLLKVTGFPTYFLVDADGQVVFRTNGKDPEGMTRLEAAIQSRIQ